jgi:hypothetical protein
MNPMTKEAAMKNWKTLGAWIVILVPTGVLTALATVAEWMA